MSNSKLYRSRSNSMLAGVAGGLADYFDLDPTLVRLIWVLVAFAGGTGLFVYLVMWLIVPLNPDEPDNHRSRRTEEFRDMVINGAKQLENEIRSSAEKKAKKDDGIAENAVHDDGNAEYNDPPGDDASDDERRRRSGKLVGLILVIVGVFMVLDTLFQNFDIGEFWPVILIVIGCYKLFSGFKGGER